MCGHPSSCTGQPGSASAGSQPDHGVQHGGGGGVPNQYHHQNQPQHDSSTNLIPGDGLDNGSTMRETKFCAGAPEDTFHAETEERKKRKKKKADRKPEPKSWAQVWYEFTQTTTFHGVGKITESTPFCFRRVLWLLIVVAGMAMFVWQAIHSVVYFLSKPVTVNIKINYNQSIIFPAVSICNQNVFRASLAASYGYYHMIDEYYSRDEHAVNESFFEMYNAENVTLTYLYDRTAHAREDFIVSCRWDNTTCNMYDFIRTITDHGICYTFNSGVDTAVRRASQTGVEAGLRLQLNVEQYEYMRGPNSAAGVKILVHDQREVALVKELGQAIPPESHAFVGIQMLEVHNLEPPYGICSNGSLRFMPTYTMSACEVDCKEKHLLRECGCREPYMREESPGYPPVCTLLQYNMCVIPALETFHVVDESFCSCLTSVPCSQILHETSITYGVTSGLYTAHALQTANMSSLGRKYLIARETQQRVDDDLVDRDKEMVIALDLAMDKVEKSIGEIIEKMTWTKHMIDSMFHEMMSRSYYHMNLGLSSVSEALQKAFVQGWYVEQKTVFEPLISDTKQFLTMFDKTLSRFANVSHNESDLRQFLQWQMDSFIDRRQDLLDTARLAIDRVNTAFDLVRPLRKNNNWTIIPGYDDYLLPAALIQRKPSYREYLADRTRDALTELQALLPEISNIVQDTELTNSYSSSTFVPIRHNYTRAMDNLKYAINIFREEYVDQLQQGLDKSILTFTGLETRLRKEHKDVMLTIQATFEVVRKVREEAWPNIVELLSRSKQYVHHMDRNKTFLAQYANLNSVVMSEQHMKEFFHDVRARGQNFEYDWKRFYEAFLNVWFHIKQEEATRPLYEQLNEDFQELIFQNISSPVSDAILNISTIMQGPSPVSTMSPGPSEQYIAYNADVPTIEKQNFLKRWYQTSEEVISASNMARLVEDEDNIFSGAFKDWQSSLSNFLKSTEIDVDFFKENFLELDVFIQELHYQEIEQQIAYGWINLWSDIGGSMGLFVGASVITVFELLDVVIHTYCQIVCSGMSKHIATR